MNQELEDQISSLRRSASPYFRNKDYSSMIVPLEEAWSLMPEPKNNCAESFLVARMFCETYIGLEDFETADKWVEIYKKADLERIDNGERDFMEARLFYHKGNFDAAKKSFEVANQKSEGRFFKNPSYLEYFQFFKKK